MTRRRHFWLCASYRITHDDFVFRRMEHPTIPKWPGLIVFSEAPMVVYEGEDPAEKIGAIKISSFEDAVKHRPKSDG